MEPVFRQRMMAPDTKDAMESAVLILLYAEANDIKLILTLKQADLGVHSGQISLPGGKKDASDASYADTALRETFEEIGVELHRMEILGKLSPLFVPPSNFIIHPYVGFTHRRPQYVLSDNEVARLFEVNLDGFFAPENKTFFTKEFLDGKHYEVPAYKLDDYFVWGATAMILSEFEAVCGEVDYTF